MRSGVYMAVDFGTVRIGVAACDPAGILAFPVATIQVAGAPMDDLATLVEEYDPEMVFVGLPLTLRGEESFAAEAVRTKARELQNRIDVPIRFVDERMTTAQAAKKLRESGKDARKARGRIDAFAAVSILESVIRAMEQGQPVGAQM